MSVAKRRCVAAALAACTGLGAAAPPVGLAPLVGGDVPGIAAPWRFAGLPQQSLPPTEYRAVRVDGVDALRIEARGSYGNLVHALPPGTRVDTLAWRWRVDLPNRRADLATKAGDDSAVKVCVLFDAPLAQVPFVERQLLRLARAASAEPLPAATLCYVWAHAQPAGAVLANAYSRRVRYVVLRSADAPLATWLDERRDVAADYLRAFGDEAREMPPASAIAVAGDADNTGAHSVAHVSALRAGP
ncbi:DUF3047 domain-containing protein [Azohydromonas sediminis]|uniref:DUF3047 domain-containing protein n=1 Tax=Azohydromonas sediminis TaxID=2259674 RepID=UPI0013C2D521|nr:DUF3047 domain-containing protein [Azohydromonas sediminis]